MAQHPEVPASHERSKLLKSSVSISPQLVWVDTKFMMHKQSPPSPCIPTSTHPIYSALTPTQKGAVPLTSSSTGQ